MPRVLAADTGLWPTVCGRPHPWIAPRLRNPFRFDSYARFLQRGGATLTDFSSVPRSGSVALGGCGETRLRPRSSRPTGML